MVKEGKLIRKLSFVSVENDSSGLKISTYINNYEIENYFLKAIGFADQNELQSLNGARFMIKKTEVNGDIKVFSSNIIRNTKHQLPILSGLFTLRSYWFGEN